MPAHLKASVVAIIAYIASASDNDLGAIAGALLAKMESRYGPEQALTMLQNIVKLAGGDLRGRRPGGS